MSKPLISVLMTNYNKEKYISYILNMILEQNTNDIEIILIDDGSNDSSVEIIDEILSEKGTPRNLKYIKHDINKGVAYTKQEALDISTGDYFIYIDCDDFIPEDYIETLIIYAKDKKYDIYNFSARIYPYGETVCFGFALWTKLIRKKYIEEIKIKFNTDLKNMDDVDLWKRLCNADSEIENRSKIVDKVIYYYNVFADNTLTHEESLWHKNKDNLKEECK